MNPNLEPVIDRQERRTAGSPVLGHENRNELPVIEKINVAEYERRKKRIKVLIPFYRHPSTKVGEEWIDDCYTNNPAPFNLRKLLLRRHDSLNFKIDWYNNPPRRVKLYSTQAERLESERSHFKRVDWQPYPLAVAKNIVMLGVMRTLHVGNELELNFWIWCPTLMEALSQIPRDLADKVVGIEIVKAKPEDQPADKRFHHGIMIMYAQKQHTLKTQY